jgi:hypothetical protein
MGMKEIYEADRKKYSATDDLIRKGNLGDVWKIHPDNPHRMKVKHKNKPKPHDQSVNIA